MSSPRRFSTLGGHPALDLANTVTWRLDPGRRRDYVSTYAEALRCLEQLGVLTSAERTVVERQATRSPELAAFELEELKRLREAVYGVVVDDSDAADELSRHFADAIAAATLTRGDGALRWSLPADVRLPRLRMAQLAIDLVTENPSDRLRQCDDDACGWVFLDRSPRRNRRWCDSADCGNRNRVRAHYERERSSASS